MFAVILLTMQAIYLTSIVQCYNEPMQTGRPSMRQRPPFGVRLHSLREQAGLSQQQMADKLSIPQRTYAYWEREPVALRAEQINSLAKVLNASPDFLLGFSEQKNRSPYPIGKARQVFEKVSKLPRKQQTKILEVVEAFVNQQAKAA